MNPILRAAAVLLVATLALPLPAQAVETTAPATTAPPAAAPVKTPPADTFAAPAALREILDGGVPKTVADLRAMQDHTRKLLAYTLPRTVTCNGASGVLIPGGLVLTCAHVIRRADQRVLILLHDGTRLEARSLGLNHRTDAGLVKIVAEPAVIDALPVARMGRVSALEAGQWVAMLGQTGGRKSWRDPPLRLGRLLRVPSRGYLVSDCTMAGGDSGGPLFDMDGRVIGINSRINRSLQMNMHVPIDAFHDDWNKLIDGETIGTPPSRTRGRRPTPSFDGGPAPGAIPDPGVDDAASIKEVVPGSPAAAAGIRAGDVIVGYKRGERLRRLRNGRALQRRVYGFAAGDRITLVVRRGERTLQVELKLGAVPQTPRPRRRQIR